MAGECHACTLAAMVEPITFTPLPSTDPLHRALAKIGELYTATNFLTWWDARGFSVRGDAAGEFDPSSRDDVALLAAFVEQHVLPSYRSDDVAFGDHVARVGRVGWDDVRSGLLDALKHHPTAGGVRPGTAAGQFSPHAFMLLDIVEDQVASALGIASGRTLSSAPTSDLKCARLRPSATSAFRGSLYQHLFVVYAPGSRRLLWFDLGGAS
jgi:hypothetical protein